MRIGIFDGSAGGGGTIDGLVANAERSHDEGFASFWVPQIFGVESLVVLGIIGREVPAIELGTAVVPTYPRHPATLAAEALTVQAASGGRLTLGIGLSHQIVIESMFGLSFDKPVQHMREYLAVLLPLIRKGTVSAKGQTISTELTLDIPGAEPCPVMLAALGPKMLELAGGEADGTVTWMTGPNTLADHIVPSITAAAERSGRSAPRVIASLPVAVTSDPAAAREQAATQFQMYGYLPSYRAMLDREGAEGPADVAICGSADEVTAAIGALGDVGVTDFVAAEFLPEAAESTRAALRSLL